jgi:alkylation response protein AidB-like acyl-CoA dehydrogenase
MHLDLDALDRVIADVIVRDAETVDRDGELPKAGLDALREIGVLGLTVSQDAGGGGADLRVAADVIERLARACGSTAMVVLMHYAAVAVVDAHGAAETRRAIAGGDHLTTLAFSEVGSRSQFWNPTSTATIAGDDVVLDARKSWVTGAAFADSFVWSSRPATGAGAMSLWLVPASTHGIEIGTGFDGMGLRGNGSVPVTAVAAHVDRRARLGGDGTGLDVALTTALPWFLVLSAAFSVGLMEAVVAETASHLTSTRFEHLDAPLIAQPIPRADYARMRVTLDTVRAFLDGTLDAVGRGADDAVVRVLESKVLAAEAAIDVTDLAMKVCGGAAFRRELGIERRFRDARAARVMAPTSDALLDFVGRATTGMPLLDA